MEDDVSKKTKELRYVKFDYYQAFIQYKEPKKRRKEAVVFNLAEWLVKMSKITKLEDRNIGTSSDDIIRLNSERAITHTSTVNQYDTRNFVIMQFARLLDVNVPYKVKIDTPVMKAVELDSNEFIGHDVSAVFDETNCVLMLQKNYFSLSKGAIEVYINTFWNQGKKSKRDWDKIQLLPIIDKKSFHKGQVAKKYRKLTFSTAPMVAGTQGPNPFGKGQLGKMIDSMKAIQGTKLEVTISVKKGNSVLDKKEVLSAINSIGTNSSDFSSAKVVAGDVNFEQINLFGGRLQSELPFNLPVKEALNADTVQTSMIAEYDKKSKEIESNLNKIADTSD